MSWLERPHSCFNIHNIVYINNSLKEYSIYEKHFSLKNADMTMMQGLRLLLPQT